MFKLLYSKFYNIKILLKNLLDINKTGLIFINNINKYNKSK